jgi:RNA-directed DNA polymerase
MQTKLHRWASADRGRQFDDLFNFEHDRVTLIVGLTGRGNQCLRTIGVDGLMVGRVEETIGVAGFLGHLRADGDLAVGGRCRSTVYGAWGGASPG